MFEYPVWTVSEYLLFLSCLSFVMYLNTVIAKNALFKCIVLYSFSESYLIVITYFRPYVVI